MSNVVLFIQFIISFGVWRYDVVEDEDGIDVFVYYCFRVLKKIGFDSFCLLWLFYVLGNWRFDNICEYNVVFVIVVVEEGLS